MLTVELSRALGSLKGKIITRFAPAPTGRLHSGHVLSALFVWGIGRLAGAEVLLRMEDHDKGRSSKEYESGIIEDLAWLGFISGDVSEYGGKNSYIRQSDRGVYYSDTLHHLKRNYKTYFCNCSRSDIQKRNAGLKGEIPYDSFCADLNLSGDGHSIRLELPLENIEFFDAIRGPHNQIPKKQCGDIALRDRKYNWTYQFCAAADDMDQDINFIIRGEDLFESAARQVQLARMLGRKDDAVFLHHPLLLDREGQKLGKRFGSKGISELRKSGMDSGDVLGAVAYEAGLISKKEHIYIDEMERIFEPLVK